MIEMKLFQSKNGFEVTAALGSSFKVTCSPTVSLGKPALG